MSTTLLVLEQRLSEAIGDWLEFECKPVATATGSSIGVLSATLNTYDGGGDGYFNDWWLYINETDIVNSGVLRKVRDYKNSSGALYVYGADLTVSTSTATSTCRLHRFSRNNKVKAINRAIEQLYPSLFRKLEDRTLVTGNILPDNSFEMWTSATAASFYSTSNASLARTTTAAYLRGMMATTSMKVTVSATNGYAYLSSNDYPRLLDLMGKGVTFKCWAYPEVDDDAFVEIYTLGEMLEGEYAADAGTDATKIIDSSLESSTDDYYNGHYVWNTTRGLGALVTNYVGATKTLTVAIAGCVATDVYSIHKAQTLTSTTASPASKWTLLELENQALNDNLVEVQIRFKVATNNKYTYFDSARVIGMNLYEYLLLSDWDDGHISQVWVQTSGYSGDMCDDLNPRYWDKNVPFRTYHDGTYFYLRLKELHTPNRQIRVIGYRPMETLTLDTDTISLDGEKLNLIVAQAAYNLYQMERGIVSSEDRSRYEQELNYWAGQVRRLRPTLMMMRPADQLWTGY